MRLEIEIGDALSEQIQTAQDFTGLSREELIRRAAMTFCWISPQTRWEFLHLLDHGLVEAELGMERIAALRPAPPSKPPASASTFPRITPATSTT